MQRPDLLDLRPPVTADDQPPGWVRYWFISGETAWPYRTVGIDAREVPAGGKVLVHATCIEPGSVAAFDMRVDPVQLDQLAAQWLEFRRVTSGTPAEARD